MALDPSGTVPRSLSPLRSQLTAALQARAHTLPESHGTQWTEAPLQGCSQEEEEEKEEEGKREEGGGA